MCTNTNLIVCDALDNLALVHYKVCDNTSSETTKHFRGVVIDKDGIVMKSFPYTPTYVADKVMFSSLNPDLSIYRIFSAYEGTLIRVFNHSGMWYISTHRKLDAYQSKWASSESFGSIFQRGIEGLLVTSDVLRQNINEQELTFDAFLQSLDPEIQYMFLVGVSHASRIVSTQLAPFPSVWHVGSYIKNVFDIDHSFGVPKPLEHFFDTLQSVTAYVETTNPFLQQGVFIVGSNFDFFKIISTQYNYFYNLRGNEPDLSIRYFQLRTSSILEDFVFLYGDHLDLFNSIEENLRNVCINIYKAYVNRFIKKQYTTLPKEQYLVLRQCHDYYKYTRQKITLDIVWSIMNAM